MLRWTFDGQKTDKPASPDRPHNLHVPVTRDGGERGRNWEGHTRESSLLTAAVIHPIATAAVVLGLGVTALALLEGRPQAMR